VAPPPRVALADACPAVTRVCPADYGHHLKLCLVWYYIVVVYVEGGHDGAFALSVLCLSTFLGGYPPVSEVTFSYVPRQQSHMCLVWEITQWERQFQIISL